MVNLQVTIEETRRLKLYHLVVDGGTVVVRYRYDKAISNPSMKSNITNCKHEMQKLLWKNIISQTQYDILYPSSGTSSSRDYDITLLVALYRTLVCKNTRRDPIWRAGNIPGPTDHSVEAELVRLRDFRNNLMHIPQLSGLTETLYETKWKDICDVLLRFGHGLPGLKDQLDKMKDEGIDKKYEKELEIKLKEWTELDKAFLDEIMQTLPSEIALERSKRELSNVLGDSYFVRTTAFKKAKDVLNEKGIIVIKGAQGEGKSTIGKKLVEDPNKCLKVNKPSDLDVRNNSIDTLLIDDMFGCSTLNKGDSEIWLKYIPQLKDEVQKKQLKVIITSRSYILVEVLEKMLVSDFINDSNTLTISSKDLTDEEKGNILKKHIEMNGKNLPQSEIEECIQETNKSESLLIGFPESARLFCQNEQLFKKKREFFKSPMTHIKSCFVEIFRNEQVFLAFFVLWAQQSQELSLISLEQPISDTPLEILMAIEQLRLSPEVSLRSIWSSLMAHKTDFIQFDKGSGIFSFSHRVLSDAVGLVAYETNGTAVLKYCDSSFIMRYIKIEDNTTRQNQEETSDNDVNQVYINITPLRFSQLCTRIRMLIGDVLQQTPLREQYQGRWSASHSQSDIYGREQTPLRGQYLKYVPLLHPAFRNKQFCEIFVKDITKEQMLKLLTAPISTVRADLAGLEYVLDETMFDKEICLLAFLLNHSMTQFATICYQEMENGIECQTSVGTSPMKEVLETDLLVSMILAIKRSDKVMMRYLQKLGAPVDNQNVILTALKMANADIVTCLLDDANKNISNYRKDGKSPLILFVEANNVKAVECILNSKHFTENEINFQSTDDPTHETALHKACKQNQGEIVEQLLKANPNLLLKDVNGYCPIHVAALAGNVMILSLLLKHNKRQAYFPMNLSDQQKHIKVYHIAVAKENMDVIELLEQLDVSPGCTDDKKQTPLLFALQERKFKVILKLADISIKHKGHHLPDHKGNTALHIAIKTLAELKDPEECEIYQQVISSLCENGIDPSSLNSEGKSALQLAQFHKMEDVVEELKKREQPRLSLVHTDTEKPSTSCSYDDQSPAKKLKHA